MRGPPPAIPVELSFPAPTLSTMMRPMKVMTMALSIALGSGALTPLNAEDASAILAGARLAPTRTPAVLLARIRTEDSVSPVVIRLKDQVISYETGHPPCVLNALLHTDSTILTETPAGGGTPRILSPARLHEEFPGTGISFEDLSLGFLYWPRPVLLGEEHFGVRNCWKIDLQAPPEETVYGVARVWIDKEFGGILKIEAYDRKGLLLKRFQLISPQKIKGLWLPKQMRIEGFEPGNPSPVSRAYLEILSRSE